MSLTQMIARRAAAAARGHDPVVLGAIAGLAGVGVLLALSSSVAMAGALDMAAEHAAQLALAATAFLACALLSPRGVRRLGFALVIFSLLALVVVLFAGHEAKGAQRWIRVGVFSLQPAELLKPGFLVFCAWMLSEKAKAAHFPGYAIGAGLLAVSAALLLLQPDFGQTSLLTISFAILVFVSGARLRVLGLIALCALILAAGAYVLLPHVTARVDAWLQPGGPEQVQRALLAIRSGGLLGRGPGEGVHKAHLPEADADFVYAVGAEEFGIVLTLGVLALYAELMRRGLVRAARLDDPFRAYAAAGLFALIAVQALLHCAVNLSLLPAKGVTLPLVSHGGSSLLGAGISLGLACALIRARPEQRGQA